MTKFQLTRLVQLVGTIDARKRMQKLVYMLQVAGCQFNAGYYLHRFGPYSQDVAQLTAELVDGDILEEIQCANAAGSQYGYRLTTRGALQLAAAEHSDSGKAQDENITRYRDLAIDLASKGLWELEVASTIVYYYQLEQDWAAAKDKACSFKKVPVDSTFAAEAEALARRIIA